MLLMGSVAACGMARDAFTPVTRNIELPDGPPVEEIVTNFDQALQCLQGHLPEQVTFGVGQVVDATGRESYAEGATGRFVSQGAAEMVQSAMFRAGASVVNRRDPAILVTETQWGIRDIQRQLPVNFFISGSINSLDFIPGGGASVAVGGVGPRYRQNRILVGLDLSLTDAFSGRILASIPLQRQIFSQEVGVSVGRFFGETLVSLDAGGQQREAVNFVLRQMLNLATFELLGQLVEDQHYQRCRQFVSPFAGHVTPGAGSSQSMIASAMTTAALGPDAARPEATPAPAATPAAAPAAGGQAAGQTRDAAERSVEAQVRELTNRATVAAV
ncbi:CsgG/HfaB family protein [Roseicyclus sp.]